MPTTASSRSRGGPCIVRGTFPLQKKSELYRLGRIQGTRFKYHPSTNKKPVRGYDLGILLVHDGEAVVEVERLALGDERGERRSRRGLRGVREEVHHDRATLDNLLDGEQRLSRHLTGGGARKVSKRSHRCKGARGRAYPAVLEGLLPALAVASDDVEAFVTVFRPCP